MALEIIVPTATHLPPIGCVVDGGGITIDAGDKRGPVTVEGDCTITGWRIIGDVVGSVVLDIYRAETLGDLPATDSIIDADPPTVTFARAAESEDVAAWCGGTAQLNHRDVLEFAVLSATGFTQVRIELFRESR